MPRRAFLEFREKRLILGWSYTCQLSQPPTAARSTPLVAEDRCADHVTAPPRNVCAEECQSVNKNLHRLHLAFLAPSMPIDDRAGRSSESSDPERLNDHEYAAYLAPDASPPPEKPTFLRQTAHYAGLVLAAMIGTLIRLGLDALMDCETEQLPTLADGRRRQSHLPASVGAGRWVRDHGPGQREEEPDHLDVSSCAWP